LPLYGPSLLFGIFFSLQHGSLGRAQLPARAGQQDWQGHRLVG
jgi:hypothetical protein